MPKLQDGTKGMHVKCWHRDFHVVLGLTEGLTKLGMKPIQASSAISSAIHEVSIILDVLIFIPFGVGCKESVFIGAFANVRGTQL